MKNRKRILATLAISAVLVSPTATMAFADDQTTAPAAQSSEEAKLTPEQRIEAALKIAKFKSEDVVDLDQSGIRTNFGVDSLPGKKITIDGKSFNMVVLDEKSERLKGDIAGKPIVDVIKEAEHTHMFDMGSMKIPAYYKDGVFVIAAGFDKEQAEIDKSVNIIKDVFANILDGKDIPKKEEPKTVVPETTTPAGTTTQTGTTATGDTTNGASASKTASNTKDLVDLVAKNPIFKDVSDIPSSEFRLAMMNYGKYIYLDGVKFAIGIPDTSALGSYAAEYNTLLQNTANTHNMNGNPAYYHNGVYVKCSEPEFINKGTEKNPAREKAKELLPQIIKLLNESTAQTFENTTKMITAPVTSTSTTSESSDGGNLSDAAMSFDGDSGFGDSSAFGVDNPQTFDSSISSYIGAIGASVAGILTTMGIRKRK